MANVNVPQRNRLAKLKRRRREIERMAEKIRTEEGNDPNVKFKVRRLKKEMRYAR